MSMLNKRMMAATVVTAAVYFSPVLALGAGLPTQIVPANCTGDDPTKCSICDVAVLAQNLLNTGIYIAVFLAAILFAYAGWQALTSGGNSEKYSSAKRVFTNVAIGLIIIMVGWLVIDTLMKTFVSGSWSLPWNKICDSVISLYDHFYA